MDQRSVEQSMVFCSGFREVFPLRYEILWVSPAFLSNYFAKINVFEKLSLYFKNVDPKYERISETVFIFRVVPLVFYFGFNCIKFFIIHASSYWEAGMMKM